MAKAESQFDYFLAAGGFAVIVQLLCAGIAWHYVPQLGLPATAELPRLTAWYVQSATYWFLPILISAGLLTFRAEQSFIRLASLAFCLAAALAMLALSLLGIWHAIIPLAVTP